MNTVETLLLVVGCSLVMLGLVVMLSGLLQPAKVDNRTNIDLMPLSTNLSGVLVGFAGLPGLFQPSEQVSDNAINNMLENDF